MAETGNQKKAGQSWLLWLAGILYALPIFETLFEYPRIDEPIYLYEGKMMATGQWPYSDFFNFITPGTQTLVALSIKLLGGLSIFGTHALFFGLLCTCLWLCYQMGSAFIPRRWLLVFLAFYSMLVVPVYMVQVNHHLACSFWCLLATYSVFCFLEAPEHPKKLLLVTGFLTGISVLFTQTAGVFFGLALAVFLTIFFRRESYLGWMSALGKVLSHFVVPAVLPICIFGLVFWLHGTFKDMIYCLLQWPRESGYVSTTSFLYMHDSVQALEVIRHFSWSPWGLMQLANFSRVVLLAALPIIGLTGGFELLFRKRKDHKPAEKIPARFWQMLLLYAAGMGMTAGSLHNPNSYVVATHAFLLILLGFVSLFSWLRQHFHSSEARLATTVSVILFILGWPISAIISFSTVILPRIPSYGTIEKSLYSHIGTPPNFGSLIEAINKSTSPEDFIFVFNYTPGIYLFTDRSNASRYQILMSHYSTKIQIEEAARSIEINRPKLIVYDQHDASFFKYDIRAKNLRTIDYSMKALERVIKKSYHISGVTDNFLLLERNEP